MGIDFGSELDTIALHAPTATPTTLWIELTSRCPFDCVFCSRRLRRGTGGNLDFELYRSLLHDLDHPDCIRLNYSGESIHYDRLPEAIRLAKQTGARVELVTALAGAPGSLLRELVSTGLDRLCLSMHAVRQTSWQRIYRHRTVTEFQRAVACIIEARTTARSELPRLEIAFVAMRRNLPELAGVVAFARRCGIPLVTICPVIRRDPIEETFEEELGHGRLRESFKCELRGAVDQVRQSYPQVELRMGTDELEEAPTLGAALTRFWPPLPDGAQIRSCDQDPWATVHILSNGDAVPCEAQDRLVLGNLGRQSLREIWHGDASRSFRHRFASGIDPVCSRCPWKVACLAAPPPHSIGPSEANGPAFLRGWHPRDSSGALWSRRDAVLVLRRGDGSRGFQIQGALPPAAGSTVPNLLEVRANGELIGEVLNPTGKLLEFRTVVRAPADRLETVILNFRTRSTWRPKAASVNDDARDLGFALFRAGSVR